MPTLTPDRVCFEAVDLAREALLQEEPAAAVGDWIDALADGDRAVTHRFVCLSPAYLGWYWQVTVTRASRARTATVAEVVLRPGDGSLLAPPWVPWSERISPGDLGVGDLLPAAPDDLRLDPGYTGLDAADPDDEPNGIGPLRPPQWEIGLGRERVLSVIGRADAAARWHDGDFGPGSPMAKSAPATCASCGFLVPIGGALGLGFGVCANEMAPADGRIVDYSYGCGAHSEVQTRLVPVLESGTLDEVGYDLIEGVPKSRLFIVSPDGGIEI